MIGIFYFSMMVLSGILANHPCIITHFSVPASWVGQKALYRNWNQSSLRNIIFSTRNPQKGFAYGRAGIWRTYNNGKTFIPFMEGLPNSAPFRNIYDLYWDEKESRLFAGTEAGLFVCELDSDGKAWEICALDGDGEAILSLFAFKNHIMAITDSHFFLSDNSPPFHFKEISPRTPAPFRPKKTDIATLMLNIHNGSILGLPGKILIDFAGFAILFLSLSAFYIWYYPVHAKRRRKKKKGISYYQLSLFRFFHKYHSKLGIWTIPLVLIISLTSFLIFLPISSWQSILIFTLNFNSNDITDKNPWKEKIEKALYNPDTQKIMILTKDGLIEWDRNLQSPWKKLTINLPPRLMGASVFRYTPKDKSYLIGSLSGLYKVDPVSGSIDYLRKGGKKITRVCGYLKKPNGDEYYVHKEKGLKLIITCSGNPGPILMPEAIAKNSKTSLWKFCSDLHSGRIFKPLLGQNTWWLMPFIGTLILLCLALTGAYDWYYWKHVREKINMDLSYNL
ncbi:MAG: PepSY domain-containing protein [Deltaproteobacteria bacterium]|nr:PepSY domain-containing protein [Deltaproteobacteria bacterium]